MPAVKNVGEPCAGEPHARFDGGREETSDSRPRRATLGASRLPDQPPRRSPQGWIVARVAGPVSTGSSETTGRERVLAPVTPPPSPLTGVPPFLFDRVSAWSDA